ncbi:MAG: hypothetical protein GY870_13525 [archaeon]|nr:hypothetical protein [archaeon]
MRVRKHKNRKFRPILVLFLIISPSMFLSIYLGNFLSLSQEAINFTYLTEPDPSTFLTANYTTLEEMALYYDTRYEDFHIPLNLSCNTAFLNDNCTQVNYYGFTDNGAQWTGLAITGYVFKYITAINENNSTLEVEALRLIRKLMHGMSMLLAVPNGGLGPDYPGKLARGWVGPEHLIYNDSSKSPYFAGCNPFNTADPHHHNGTGVFSNHMWRAFTSLDEYSGFLSGLTFVFKYITGNNTKDIQDLAKLMIDQLVSYHLDTNFLGIDWHGGPTGVDMKALFFQGGGWVCLLLKMGALAFPEKYERLYYRYCAEEFYALWSREGSEHETIANYYAFAFGYHISFALLTLEDGPGKLHDLYLNFFLTSLWRITSNHRNPFYNIIYYTVMNLEPGENTILERDIEDQLMRYRRAHFPDRNFNHINVSDDGANGYENINNLENLLEFIENDPFGEAYVFLFDVMGMKINTEKYIYFNKPLTSDYMNGDIFIWESNPYQYNMERESSQENIRWEYASFCFSMIYWMGRAGGFIKNGTEGMRIV